MNAANLTSLEQLREFRTAWVEFLATAAEALVAMDGEIRRAMSRIQENHQAWQRLARQREEQLGEKKLILNRRKLSKTFGRPVDTTVEEEDVRKAQRLLQEALDKLAAIKKWQPRLDRALLDYEGPKQLLAIMLTTDAEKGTAFLDRKIATVEAYLAVQAPEMASAPQPGESGAAS
jgi:hypothetical protein